MDCNTFDNEQIVLLNEDFIKYNSKGMKYDLIIGNPPYFVIKKKMFVQIMSNILTEDQTYLFFYFKVFGPISRQRYFEFCLAEEFSKLSPISDRIRQKNL